MKIRNLLINGKIPAVCVPVTDSGEDDIVSHVAELSGQADMIEWRADFFDGILSEDRVRSVLRDIRTAAGDTPLLITLRTISEGGSYDDSDGGYADMIAVFAGSGCADLVDVEYDAMTDTADLISVLHDSDVRVIVSHHDFNRTPGVDQMMQGLLSMRECGADIVKLAVMPQDTRDVISLITVTDEFHRKYPDTPLVTMSMGQMGAISRLSGGTFGSCITFGSDTAASAPGQMEYHAVGRILRLLYNTGE